MKPQDFKNNQTAQGSTTADRAFNDAKETQKQKGVSHAGGQRSDQTSQTSSKDSAHQPQKKKD